jgi:hypothetical protein
MRKKKKPREKKRTDWTMQDWAARSYNTKKKRE